MSGGDKTGDKGSYDMLKSGTIQCNSGLLGDAPILKYVLRKAVPYVGQ